MEKQVRKYQTRGVLAGAYRGKDLAKRECLSHYYDVTEGNWGSAKTLCGRVNSDHLADPYAAEKNPATCPACLERFARRAAKGIAVSA